MIMMQKKSLINIYKLKNSTHYIIYYICIINCFYIYHRNYLDFINFFINLAFQMKCCTCVLLSLKWWIKIFLKHKLERNEKQY